MIRMSSMVSKLLPRTLFAKIANTFWLLLVAIAALQYLLMTHFWREAVDILLQRLNWGLADSLANEFVERVEGKVLTSDLVRKELHRLELLNPNVDLYILNQSGAIEWATTMMSGPENLPGNKIDLTIVENFLQSPDLSDLPIYGASPQFPNDKEVFSAARFTLNHEPKVLYVIIMGRRFHVLIDNVEAIYFTAGAAILLTVFLLFTLGMGFSAFFLVTRRFRVIVHAVHRFSQGDMVARVQVAGVDELATLGAEINAMADTAVQSLDEVKALDSLRRRMVAMISHDLGSPLRATQAGIFKAKRELTARAYEPLGESLEQASKNVETLLAHVEELFELSKLETNEITPNFEDFSLLDVVTEELLPRFMPLAENAAVSLRAEYDAQLTYRVRGDGAMIERVLSNLLQNAIHYNLPGGSVLVTLEQSAGFVEVTVADTGIGLSADDLAQVFEPFRRGQSGKNLPPGSGLGLAIVKEILRRHQQDVRVRSTVGKGTAFSFRLPLAASRV